MDRTPEQAAKLEEARQMQSVGQWTQAEQLAQQVLADGRGDAAALQILGEALTAQGRFNEAISVLTEAVGASPEAPDQVLLALASAYEKMGALEDARATYEAVLTANPANPRARGALAVIGFKLSQAARQPAAPAPVQQAPAEPSVATPAPAPIPVPVGPSAAVPQSTGRASVELPFDLPPDPDPVVQHGVQVSTTPAAPVAGGGAGMRPDHESGANVRYDLAGNPIMDAPPPAQAAPAPSGPLPPNAPPQPARQGPGVPPPGGGPGRYGPSPTYSAPSDLGEDPGDFNMANIMAILQRPAEFFASMQGCTGYNKPVLFFAITYGITLVFTYGMMLLIGGALVASMAAQGRDMGAMGASLGAGVGAIMIQAVISIVVGIPMAIASMFIGAGIMHLFVMMFGGRGGYAATFRALCYTGIPSIVCTIASLVVFGLLFLVTKSPVVVLLGYLPMIGGSIWSLVVSIIAFRELHWMSTGRAAGAVLTPSVLGFIAAVVISAGLIAVMNQARINARTNSGFGAPSGFGQPGGGFGQPGMQMPQPMAPPPGGAPFVNQ